MVLKLKSIQVTLEDGGVEFPSPYGDMVLKFRFTVAFPRPYNPFPSPYGDMVLK